MRLRQQVSVSLFGHKSRISCELESPKKIVSCIQTLTHHFFETVVPIQHFERIVSSTIRSS